ncbi:4-deoxy-L-threo-5-hexosulose-uronate ketol-isomerase [Salmonella enterica subsp. enterica serovar Worthington]|nr:4-deoxy-L-threo-5-hexosulose-uronate ketol-isomerase [Salmonella enterica subsp. enterica serovar Worthington]
MTKVGLRIDVDTLRGTREGVPGCWRHCIATAFRPAFSSASGRTIWDAIFGV